MGTRSKGGNDRIKLRGERPPPWAFDALPRPPRTLILPRRSRRGRKRRHRPQRRG